MKTPRQQTSPDNHTDDGGSTKDASASVVPHNQLKDFSGNTNSERKRRLSFSSSTSTEPEKVSIVRAAGTFFPQNCNDYDSNTSPPPPSSSSPLVPTRRKSKEYSKNCCAVAGCGDANDSSHIHCDDCSEVRFHFCFIVIFIHFRIVLVVLFHISNEISFLQVFDDESKLMTHTALKHKTNECADEAMETHDNDASHAELMQNFSKQMAKQTENLFNMEAFMNPATGGGAIPNLAALNQQPLAMVGAGVGAADADGFSFSDQLSAQIQTLCLAQLAALYQNNPIMYQHLYPLLGAVEQLKQQDSVNAQRMYVPQAANPLQLATANPFGAFDLTNLAAAATTNKKAKLAAAMPTTATATANKLQKQSMKLMSKNDLKATKSGSSDGVPANRAPGNFKIFKDEPIPKGYLKFKFNEDCGFPQCGYSNLQSHFHCCRADCHYSFCDKTRFVQHTARHERLDKLMGDDFKQYRANMSCGHDDCVYKNNLGKHINETKKIEKIFMAHFPFLSLSTGANNKSSHFHCLKCDFICSDTNKVVAHRRHHSKLEYIGVLGFRKVANNEPCTILMKKSMADDGDDNIKIENDATDANDNDNYSIATDNDTECIYSMKQTHYHCLICDCSVLSRAQLSSHQHK